MNNEVFFNINKIIERDSKVTTYKFALLRGTIEIIQDNSPFIAIKGDRVHIPMGLLIEKWLLYYYPILESNISIPQNFGTGNLAFKTQFLKIIERYKSKGGFSVFYNDLRLNSLPDSIQEEFFGLLKKLRKTISDQPMKYTGRSFNKNFHSIFSVERPFKFTEALKIDRQFIIEQLGSYSIPLEYYEAFRLLGSFINGSDSILFKWAEFSVNASGKKLSVGKIVNEVLKSPITERESKESKKIYKELLGKEGVVNCVWTGEEVSAYEVDHLIPFSIWKNNDLWNLLPSKPKTNKDKLDKIPSPSFIEERKGSILKYWNILNEKHSDRFKRELQVALLGNNPFDSWQQCAIDQLKNSCSYLINNRGYEEWKI